MSLTLAQKLIAPMNPYNSLQNYLTSQKTIATYFILFGVLLLISAGTFYFLEIQISFYRGLFMGCLFAGILLISIGFLYKNFSIKTFNSAEKKYNVDKAVFLKNETERMRKLLINFSTFQMICMIIIILAIGVILSFQIPFVTGVSLAISILFVGIMVIEAISKSSIDHYYEELLKAHSSNFILQGLD